MTKKTIFLIAILLFFIFNAFILFRWGLFPALIFTVTCFFLVQGFFATYSMLFSYLNPENLKKVKPPQKFLPPKLSFSLIIPVRNEEKVIKQTLMAMKKINYPKELYEILVIARDDDHKTVAEILKALGHLPPTFNLLVYQNFPNNKPEGLNAALEYTKKDIVAIFDAEDEPHPDILNAVNTVFSQKAVDIIQSGVQLVNVASHWYSPYNCLEYYFWFKSVLPFFSLNGANPLGGNTVFFKKDCLQEASGWDKKCLTEDAEIGIRLSAAGKKTAVIYDEEMATREETPPSLAGFIRQRTRWHQGYLQVLLKGDWLKLKSFRQKFISSYLLFYPFIQLITTLWFLTSPWFSFTVKIPLGLALFSYFPSYFLLLQWSISLIGLFHLKKNYQLTFSPWLYVKFLIFYFPYQFVLAWATIRAIKRQVAKLEFWEKTEHINAHRQMAVN